MLFREQIKISRYLISHSNISALSEEFETSVKVCFKPASLICFMKLLLHLPFTTATKDLERLTEKTTLLKQHQISVSTHPVHKYNIVKH